MANTYELFETEFRGYKKKQVDDYIAKVAAEKKKYTELMDEKNEELDALREELDRLKNEHGDTEEQLIMLDGDLTAAEDEISSLKAENAQASAALSEMRKRCDELSDRCEKFQADEKRVVRILIDTQKRSEQMLAETFDECEREKKRLLGECDGLKEELCDKISYLRNIESISKKYTSEILASVRKQADDFEAKLLDDIKTQENSLEQFIAQKSMENNCGDTSISDDFTGDAYEKDAEDTEINLSADSELIF